jgi:peptidoglycan/xylan/chitin deacetylase (PgdA/CDA1 family)
MTLYQENRMLNFLLLPFLVFVIGCNNENVSIPKTKPNIVTNKSNLDTIKNLDSIKLIVSQPIEYDTTKKYIYLTFDDGPQNGTVACFELCKKLGVKATFFMVGQHASSTHLKQIINDIKNNYPQTLLANHSTTHASGKYHYFYQHPQMAAADFYLAQKTLSVPFKIIRLPGNTSWVREGKLRSNGLTKPVCQILDSVGYNVIGWDLEWNFNHKNANPKESAATMVKRVANYLEKNSLNVPNHLVILTHDRMFRNQNYTDSLSKFISTLQQNKNYVFETVDHYPGLKKLN